MFLFYSLSIVFARNNIFSLSLLSCILILCWSEYTS